MKGSGAIGQPERIERASWFFGDLLHSQIRLSEGCWRSRRASAKTVYVDKAFQRKTNELVQKYIDTTVVEQSDKFVKLERAAIDAIKKSEEGKAIKVINLSKSIERRALENSDDPFLVAMAERARAVQEKL